MGPGRAGTVEGRLRCGGSGVASVAEPAAVRAQQAQVGGKGSAAGTGEPLADVRGMVVD